MQFHLGKKIREYAKLKGIKHTELAQRIITSKQNIQNIYRRESIDILLLVKICNVLEYNFFTDYLAQLDFDVEKEIKEVLNVLKQSLQEKNKEIEYLKEIIELQKKLGKQEK
ncbi:MAG TPA: helix-turn-helix domain-containing protein [Chitinophagales bacterium]|nr:helix-turn-helix domain-containing protein [Chitinophagales bacterium]HMW13427.1 helix-turn-helix domain-containing protein [Chitinophagales bacterium]HMX60415.1 helix-turn-helix domain-containing protein [Chitinophagales bacterium]HMY24563.1 helix-turn-helix domain-containing protein [Chitinophagales bacterium]HMZ33358.1 helix-turn-helix domain-containing protein [Chitinophagales bacterium]